MGLKVLISAYACEPHKGSEPEVGWNWVQQVARFHDLWVITRSNNRTAIEQALKEKAVPPIHWVYFDLPRWMRFWKRGRRGIHLYYYLWQVGAYFTVLRLHRQIHFDLVHHLTFSTAWLPALTSLLPVPFVWGPIGGVESLPKTLTKRLTLMHKFFEKLKELAKLWGQIDPLVRLTARRAKVILAQTPQSVNFLPKSYRTKAVVFPAVGLSTPDLREKHHNEDVGDGFRVVSIGRLSYIKGFELGLEAFARFSQNFKEAEYRIIGDGPEKRRLMRLALKLGIQGKVRFYGFLPRMEVLKQLEECHVLLHPSLRDPPVHVIVEAMAAGRPVICLDWGGPAMQITEESGFKVPIGTSEQVISGLAEALLRLAKDPTLWTRMSKAARQRATSFDWNRKGEWIRELYERLILRRTLPC